MSIFVCQVDAVVNSTNENMDLSQGAASKALLQIAGSGLQAECTQLKPLQRGQLKVTNAYKLSCQHVFHVICPPWNVGQTEQVEQLYS